MAVVRALVSTVSAEATSMEPILAAVVGAVVIAVMPTLMETAVIDVTTMDKTLASATAAAVAQMLTVALALTLENSASTKILLQGIQTCNPSHRKKKALPLHQH